MAPVVPFTVLAGYVEGDRFTYSRLHAGLRTAQWALSVERVAEILHALGLYGEDRPSRLDTSLSRLLHGVVPGIAGEAEQ
jgi:hypothetical protein